MVKKDGVSQATFYRHRKKDRQKHIFKHYCTCNCILHKDMNSDSHDSLFDSEWQAALLDEDQDGNGAGEAEDPLDENDEQHERSFEASEEDPDDDEDPDDPDDDEDPDDPDDNEDPEDPDFDDEDNQADDGNNNDRANFGLNHQHLNIQCRMLQNITVREVLIMVLTLAVRHSLTYASLVVMLIVLNTILGRKYLLETPGFHENLNYREERVKRNPDNIEDILDGQRYLRLSAPGNVLSNRNNFSYGINNDGFRITKTSNAEAQPVYLRLNELAPLSISEDDLVQAEEDLMVFLFEFEDMFQVEEMKFNVHVLMHLVEVVRSLGNLYTHSTFFFESWNHRLKKYVTSSWGTCDQVVFRLLLSTFVSAARFDLRISERVKLTMESILLGTRLDNALKVGSVYLLGKVERREISQEEQQLLQEQGVPIDDRYILVYKRAYYSNVECRSVQYTREGRTNSSNIHLVDGAFAQIQSVLVLSSGGERVAGMVCLTYDNLQPSPFLSYMLEVFPNNGHNLTWVPFDRLSSLAVKYCVPFGTFIAPVPNNTDID
ncbi:hypothetical protein FOCC_FOCC014321 [Frankliniella occidentalis]|nr:hypothetical protein FOCC_FOCC014321 [Frankliniella occidentalis]